MGTGVGRRVREKLAKLAKLAVCQRALRRRIAPPAHATTRLSRQSQTKTFAASSAPALAPLRSSPTSAISKKNTCR